ncbi:MAG TPA: hypothetical protein DCQ33_06245, partial [Nitrospira sp.]|nr:hypothetical protein [Nitrospira sp.]
MNILLGIVTTILVTLSQIMMNTQRLEYDYLIAEERLKQDIIQRQQVEAALQESENHYQRMVATVPGMLYDYILYPDGNNKFLYVGSSCHDILELNENDLLADISLFWNLIRKEDVQRLQEEDVAANREGRIFYAEVRIVTPSGCLKWVQLSSRPNPALLGQPAIWSDFLLDITERKQAEEKLHLAASVFAHAREGILITSADGTIIDVNEAFTRITGYPLSLIHI